METPPELQLRKQPKQQRSRELVDKVLDAAMAIAEESGLAKFNTNAVAERAGVEISSIYQYFPNKESILFLTTKRWLEAIRSACDELEQEPYLSLAWREFFAQYGDRISNVPGFKSGFASMQSLWVLYPEYQSLSDTHRQYLVEFVVRHCQRLGATVDEPSLRARATYLYIASTSVIQSALTVEHHQADKLLALDFETWLAMLEQIMPD
ncbi:TetR/AcrR family transcriptional regulator [Oceanicoccus sp. KOV_DT_Chl]|uniref:TetR/AcrR family transcriptional regulator n=1 Tax=Oceanicoccus sp. KOV_DT_Chl TaxID=1904639 RepID=UPI000C7C9C45|nr:TetR/AcrR family transcriptional regulator [Oceanicoccus sp. KOV_DT_Chl]